MSRGNLIGLFVAVALASAVSGPPVAAQARAIDLEVKDGKAKAEGQLTKDDPLDVKGRKGSYSKAYAVRLDAGVYRVDALSKAFDAYLRLEDAAGDQVASDDDSGPEDSNARITFRTVKGGPYRVVVTSFNPGRVGAFTLLVTRLDAGKAARLALQDGRVSVEGKLTKDDSKDLVRNTPCKEYLLEMEAGKTYRIDHASKAFDAFLRLEDEAGKRLAANDDGGEGTNARIIYRCTKAGTYRVIPTTLNADGGGAFTLSVEAAAIPKANRLALKDGKASVEGTLTKNDPPDAVRQQSRCQVFTVEMQEGKSYRIDLMSKAFDAYLRLEDDAGKPLADNDDGGEGTNARILFRCDQAGSYVIVATHLAPDTLGAFTLSVAQIEPARPAALALKDGRASVDAELTKEDPKDTVRNTPCRIYLVEMEADRTYRIDHASKAFDAFLRVEDADGKQLASDDDGGDGTNARILFRPTKAGTYRVIPTTLNAGRVGAFTLSVQAAVPPQPLKGGARLALKDGKFEGAGTLTRDDPLDKVRQQSRCQVFALDMQAGKSYRIDLRSSAFDAFLRLEDPDGKQLAADDDGGGGTNARITHRCTRDGAYRVVATHLDANVLGAFTLSVAHQGETGGNRLTLEKGRAGVDAVLTKDDPKDGPRNTARKVYLVELEANKSYRIDHASKVFDAYLRIEDEAGKQLAENDDGGEGTNSRITFRPMKTATYRVIPTTLAPESYGAFTLTIAQAGEAGVGAPLVLKDGNGSVNDELTKDDPRDRVRNAPCRVYLVKLEANRTYQIDHVSAAFDAYLRLEDDAGKQLAADDDGGGGTNARVTYRPTKAGTYRVIPTTLNAERVGAFTLSVRASVPVLPIKSGARLVLKGDSLDAEGVLTRDDPFDKVRQQSHCQTFTLDMEQGATYRIDLRSKAFDSYLRLEDDAGKQLAADDDGGGNLDARITHRCSKSGTYRVIATTQAGGGQGAFALAVTKVPAARMRRLVLKDNKASVEGQLAADDTRDAVRNTPCQIFLVELEAGQACRIDHASRAFDAFLRLEDPDGKQVAANDDGGDGTNSRIVYRATRAGSYQIIATSLGGQTGAFTLSVTRTEAPRPVRIALKDGKVSVEDVLTADAAVLGRGGGEGNAPLKLYHVELEANRSYQIDLRSKAFDSFLRLAGADGKLIAADDDGGGNLDSRVTFRCHKAGTYQITATTLGNRGANVGKGDFTLAVQQGARVPELKLEDGQVKIESVLSQDDAKDYGSAAVTPSRAYAVKMEVGEVYQIDLSSRKFDAYLRLQGPDGATVAENDDGGEGLDAKIVFRCTTAGTYYLVAKTVANPNKFGAFTLAVRQQK